MTKSVSVHYIDNEADILDHCTYVHGLALLFALLMVFLKIALMCI